MIIGPGTQTDGSVWRCGSLGDLAAAAEIMERSGFAPFTSAALRRPMIDIEKYDTGLGLEETAGEVD